MKKRKLGREGRIKERMPDAGHSRNELLKRRKDDLEELAEEANEQIVGGAGDLKDYKIDREIAQHMATNGAVNIQGLDPNYVYCGVSEKYPTNSPGIRVTEKSMIPGWEVVQGDMPEAKHPGNRYIRDVRGYIVIGDSVLMRCRKDIAHKLMLADRENRRRYYGGESGDYGDAMERGQRLQVARELDPEDPRFKRLMSQEMADQFATKKFTEMLSEGRVPGREINVR